MASDNDQNNDDDDDSRYIFSSQPNIRNACDACHKRKIRCIVSKNGGPCYNCKSRGLSCYFLPRYRSGRPRRRENSSPEMIGAVTPTPTPPNTNDNPFWPASQKTTVVSSTRKPPAVIDRRAIDRGPNNDMLGWGSDQIFTAQLEEQDSTNMREDGQQLRLPRGLDATFMELEQQSSHSHFADTGFQLFSSVQPNDLPEVPSSSLIPDIQASIRSPISRPVAYSNNYQNETYGEGGFASLLDHCSRLQRHLLVIEECESTSIANTEIPTPIKPWMSDKRIQEMLEDIDASCKLMLEMCDEEMSAKLAPAQVSTQLDSASISLIIAVGFKVFQICDVLFNGPVLKVHSMRDILQQKRLDFNITQARIVTVRLEQLMQNRSLILQELSKKAAYIEEKFTSQRERHPTGMGNDLKARGM